MFFYIIPKRVYSVAIDGESESVVIVLKSWYLGWIRKYRKKGIYFDDQGFLIQKSLFYLKCLFVFFYYNFPENDEDEIIGLLEEKFIS